MINSDHQIVLKTLTIAHTEVLQSCTWLCYGGAKVLTHLADTKRWDALHIFFDMGFYLHLLIRYVYLLYESIVNFVIYYM